MDNKEQIIKAFKMLTELRVRIENIQKKYVSMDIELTEQSNNSEISSYVELYEDVKNEINEISDELTNNYKKIISEI
ncbi:MAG TPA: hypothetical protein VKT28_21440 [Puia sp.]|nr:hypothetical protein [Puia sp.]